MFTKLTIYATVCDASFKKLAQMQHTDSFSAVKIKNFIRKKVDVFHIFAQNNDCDCGCTLDLPRRYCTADLHLCFCLCSMIVFLFGSPICYAFQCLQCARKSGLSL